jgi:hypothetical protein
MNSSICTLFEGHYHYGVAGLTNSLHQKGYRGNVYAGYKGALPDWTSGAIENPALQWPGARTMSVAGDIQLHFLPLETDYHLTNYKPDFMIRLWDGPAKGSGGMFYFDPDIVVTADWSFFEDWISCGIALCEDVNSPLSANHPRRVAWRRYFGAMGISLSFKEVIYANGGFVGLTEANRGFLDQWVKIQEGMAIEIGGLGKSSLKTGGEMLSQKSLNYLSCFSRTDQDALNASVESWDGTYSHMGKVAMNFERGGLSILPHALGNPKPWRIKPVKSAFMGVQPRIVDREFWNCIQGPIISFSDRQIRMKKMGMMVAKLIGRFYSKN